MLLAIETATRGGAVAAADPTTGALLEAVELEAKSAATALAPAVARLLEAHGPATAYAIDLGPGSFTGLRVGVAFLKGLARARPAPVVGLGSLEVLAAELLEGAGAETRALAVLAASGGQVFAGLFGPPAAEASTELAVPAADPRVPVALYRTGDLAARLEGLAGLRVGGDGADRLPESALEAAARRPIAAPSASILARLAVGRLSAGAGVRASEIEPAYHQRSAAEEKGAASPRGSR